jgi:PucR family transcriptional regulator, purine catabolism regulatory protein
VAGTGRTFYDERAGWLVTTVGARGEDWGRVILARDGAPAGPDTVLIERAASALALGRLLARQQESLERQAHRTLISAIADSAHADPDEAAARARALGVPVSGRQLIAAIVRIRDSGPGISAHARIVAVTEAVADACRDGRVPALVGSLDDVRAGALLSLPARADADQALTALSARLRQRLRRPGTGGEPFVLGIGTPTETLRDLRRSFLEARQVGDVAIRQPAGTEGAPGRGFYRLPDLRLRGLLHLLRDDARLQTFAERELGPLLAADDAHGTRLLDCLAAYLEAGGNKAVAAQRAHLARPTFYQRLQQIERILGADLGAAESRTSLHVALLALGSGDRLPAPPPETTRTGPAPGRNGPLTQLFGAHRNGISSSCERKIPANSRPVINDQPGRLAGPRLLRILGTRIARTCGGMRERYWTAVRFFALCPHIGMPAGRAIRGKDSRRSGTRK